MTTSDPAPDAGPDGRPDDWAARRRRNAADQAARAARAREVETARARVLIDGFVDEARRRGLATTGLTAATGGRWGRVRTGLTGWYLMRDGAYGVSEAGEYYNLATPGGLRARLRGVTLSPADPPLQVGAGARDGESMALDALLRLRLEAGDSWPPPS